MPSGTDAARLGRSGPPDASAPPAARPYFPCLEGLRALAASLVVVHHAAALVGPGAGRLATPAAVMDIGVSVFFVLSGFLIYRPFVVAGLAGGRPTRAVTFWWRRILRIVPAYWVALTILWAAGFFELGADWWRYYLFLQIYDPFTALGGIVPAWSLNTEMAFYLCIPAYAWAVRRLGRASGRPLAVEVVGGVGLVVAGYVSRAIFSGVDRVWVAFEGRPPVTMREVSFSWLPNNLDLFGLGILLAVASAAAARADGGRLRARLDRVCAPAWAWWGLAVALFAWFAYEIGAPQFNGGYKGGYWQLRMATFGAIAVCMLLPSVFGPQDRDPVRRGLRLRPVVWVGVVSYGLYLWHQDLLERLPQWLDRPADQIPLAVAIGAGFVLGLTAAAASWYALERPVQRRFRGRSRPDPGPDPARS